MTSPFLAEIRIFPFNYAPRGWAFCNGQLLPISQSTALFSLLGVTYGGDGRSNFGLPNLQGNAPMQQGQGPGLSPYVLGQSGGSQNVKLSTSQMPGHTHALMASRAIANSPTPSPSVSLARTAKPAYTITTSGLTNFASQAIGTMAGDQPHNNMMPYLTLNFCIALQGVFPQRP